MDEGHPKSGRGQRRNLTDPAGTTYLAQAARSGFIQWPLGGAQGPMGWAVHTIATFLVNRLVFSGGWTVVVWQGDDIAPKRRTVVKRRYRTATAAIEALNDLAVTIVRYGLPAP